MKKQMSKMDAQAKMDVLKELYDMCSESLKGKVKGGMDEMKQVTVAAPDAEGLEEGLEMASELAPEMAEASEETEENPEMPAADEDEDHDSIFANLRKKKSLKDY